MRRVKTICRTIVLATLLFFLTPIFTNSVVAVVDSPSQSINRESQLSPDDWKIVIDGEKASNEFGFIQKNLDSSNLADNGQFLLILGTILLVCSGTGIIFFSFCLYKLLKDAPQKSTTKRGGTRYK